MHNIRVLREKIGFSQQQVAESVNVSQQAVARWENGLAKPRADLLPELAVLFHCTIDELFKEPDNKTPPAGRGRRGGDEMIVLSAPGELSPNTKEVLRKEVKEKTGEECIVLDCGMELTQISVKKDSATGGNQ